MSATELTIVTTVGEAERPLVIAGVRQLSAAIEGVLGRAWPVHLVCSDPDGLTGAGAVWVGSMIDDVQRGEPIAATTRRWQERITRWSGQGRPRILLATLFRGGLSRSGGPTAERIRRLNRMALALSRQSGIEIVDIDRLFAWCGARVLHTDYRCLGARAAGIGGHALAAALFAGHLDDGLADDIQDRAAGRHGGTVDVGEILKRWIPNP